MYFIELTYLDNTKTWVNMKFVVAFEVQENHTRVHLSTADYFNVKETPNQILAQIPVQQ